MEQEQARGPFSIRTVFWILLVGGTAFAGAMFLTLFSDRFEPSGRAGANSYSWSAIGHRAFFELLNELGVPAEASRHDSARKVGPGEGVLVLAEPYLSEKTKEKFRRLLDSDAVLLVLPKWTGRPDPARIEWLKTAKLKSETAAAELLKQFAPGAKIIRPKTEQTWRSSRFSGLKPDIVRPQLLDHTSHLTPVIRGEDGILLGEAVEAGKRLLVLSDPDLISNHGLRRGDNAALAIRIIEFLREGKGPVIIDETMHGFEVAPNVFASVFEPPLLALTLQAAAALAVLLLAVNARFGTPQAPEPVLKPGKQGLIGNTAHLLRFGGHDRALLSRYLLLIIQETARKLHIPATAAVNATDGALIGRLVTIGQARGLSGARAEAPRRAAHLASDPQTEGTILLRMARDLYQWKLEILHERGTDPGR